MKHHIISLCPVIFFSLVAGTQSGAQNPICPPGVYFADPSARVWNDGRLYLYGSTDESCDYYCSWRHDVMFTGDMHTWGMVTDVFASAGEHDQVPYNNSLLFAPDCAFGKDTFFLYYCQPDKDAAEGTAVSTTPAGPFTNGTQLHTYGHNQIDPSVFTDDDGTAYYIWGQFSLKMARLMPGMRAIDSTSIREDVLTEEAHHFHEGAYLTKRNGVYYTDAV